jgi:hypothetical protein
MKNKVFLSSLAVLAIVLCIAGCKKPNPVEECTYEIDKTCFCEKNPSDSRCENTIDPPTNLLPDSIAKGTNFYNIFMDATAEGALGNRVVQPTMMRDYDVWGNGQTLASAERLGINSWGFPEAWVSWDVADFPENWNGGAIIAYIEEFEVDAIPDLSAIDNSYTFHFAVKSPTNQTNAGLSVFIYSEGSDCKYYVGPHATAPIDNIYLDNYPHDGEWHHFEIPVSDLKNEGWVWTGNLKQSQETDTRPNGKHARYLVGYQSNPHVAGTELNLDAIFYYKKPAN